MNCPKCGLLIGHGTMGTTLPLCQCQWNAADFQRPEDHAALYSRLIDELSATKEKLAQAEHENGALQAHIDRLMLEYCPDDMTQEQINTWAKHQRKGE